MLSQFIDIANMEVIDIVRSSVLIVAFLAIAFGDYGGRKFIHITEASLWMIGIASFFFPHGLFSYVIVGKFDIVHQFIVQCIGIVHLSFMLTTHFTFKPTEQAQGATLLVRFMGLLGGILIHCTARSTGKINFTPQHLSFFILFMVLMALGFLIQMYRQGDFGRHTVQYSLNSGINRHLMLDVVVMGIGAVYDLAYTDEGFSFYGVADFKADNAHIFLGKIYAVNEMAMFFMGMMALGFADDRDKQAIFVQRLIMCVIFVPCVLLYQCKHSLLNFSGQLAIGVFVIILVLNSAWALWGNPINALSAVTSPQAERVLRRRKDN